MLFGSRTINCFQEEAFGNLLSRLADREVKFLESLVGHVTFFSFFLPTTRVYFVIKLARATKH